ncbi:HTH domain-containing protein [Flavobacteriaceae bacterium R38]|nr:HTH domain-containing protein [Flavobacteriaceae bacterium R38]
MKSIDGMPRNRIKITRKRVFNGKPIRSTRRVERVLKLIIWLKEYRTIKGIAKHLNIHEKSVNRYLNLMVQLGFDVEVKTSKYHEYRITNIQEYFKLE